ncbi:MAG: hypothetical protein ACI30R_06805 [Sodaliphilus sp.]
MNTQNAKSENCLKRNQEMLSIYNEALHFMIKNRVPNPHKSALHWTLHYGTPSYCVSYKRAYAVMCQLFAGHSIGLASPMRKQMWHEIYHKVDALLKLHPSMSIAQALDFVLSHSRASRFFVTEQQARRSISNCRKRRSRNLQSLIHHQS